jgi:hypothetical protein
MNGTHELAGSLPPFLIDFFSRLHKRFACLCIKEEKKFNIIYFSGVLGDQKNCTWTLRSILVY